MSEGKKIAERPPHLFAGMLNRSPAVYRTAVLHTNQFVRRERAADHSRNSDPIGIHETGGSTLRTPVGAGLTTSDSPEFQNEIDEPEGFPTVRIPCLEIPEKITHGLARTRTCRL